jgi:hypothetical protein
MKASKIYLVAIALTFSLNILAQTSRPHFVGFQPAMTIEPFYEEGEFDINLIPLVVQVPVNKQVDIRVVSLANYHFGGVRQEFSDIGLQVLTPIYFKAKENTFDKSSGFYIAPVVGYGRNQINSHTTIVLAAEPGYLFKADNRFTLSVGLQYGRTYFNYDKGGELWREHLGLGKVNIGWWLYKK